MSYVMLVALGCLWSLRLSVIKYLGESGVPPLMIFQVGLFGILVILLLGLAATRTRLPLTRSMLFFCTISGLLGMVIPFIVETLVAPKIAVFVFVVIITTVPVWILILAAIVGPIRPNAAQWVGILVGFGAVLLIAADLQEIEFSGETGWMLFACLVPVCYALVSTFVAIRWPSGVNALQVSAGQAIIACTTMLIALPLTGIGNGSDLNGSQIGGLAAIGIFEACGLAFYMALVRREGAPFVGQANYASIAFAALWSFLIFNEPLGWLALVGGVILVASLIWLAMTRPAA